MLGRLVDPYDIERWLNQRQKWTGAWLLPRVTRGFGIFDFEINNMTFEAAMQRRTGILKGFTTADGEGSMTAPPAFIFCPYNKACHFSKQRGNNNNGQDGHQNGGYDGYGGGGDDGVDIDGLTDFNNNNTHTGIGACNTRVVSAAHLVAHLTETCITGSAKGPRPLNMCRGLCDLGRFRGLSPQREGGGVTAFLALRPADVLFPGLLGPRAACVDVTLTSTAQVASMGDKPADSLKDLGDVHIDNALTKAAVNKRKKYEKLLADKEFKELYEYIVLASTVQGAFSRVSLHFLEEKLAVHFLDEASA